MRRLWLVGLALVIPLALFTEDPDARLCTNSGGEVVIDTFPHQPAYYRCEVNGKSVRIWKHDDGENVLVWGS